MIFRLFKSIIVMLIPGSILLSSCLPDGEMKTTVNHQPLQVADGWEISAPSEQGFNATRLQGIYEMMFSEDEFITSTSLLIVRNGKLVSESYFRNREDVNKKVSVQGITKSITSLLAGSGLERGLIELDERLYNHIPYYFDGDQKKREMTVRHMLTMTIGLDWDNEKHSIDLFNSKRFPSTIRIVLTKPFLSVPGSTFFYNQGPPQLALGILKQVYNLSATDSIVNSLFDPLGIDDFIWEQHEDGLHIGGLGLHLRPRDLARIGQLCLQKGSWDGSQIVSSEWIDQATSMHVIPEMTGTSFGYGFYWWIDEENEAFFAMGDGGQYLYIVPGKDLVIVHTATPSVGSGYYGIESDDFLTLANMVIDSIE